MKDTMEENPAGADSAAFAQSLSALKERGSNLLVVGGGLDGVHEVACDRLLGETDEEPRRRVFVRTDGTTGCGMVPTHGAGVEEARAVVQATATRSAAVHGADSTVPTRRVPEMDAGELASATVAAIDDLKGSARALSPAELRLCFDSLLPLFAEHDDEQVYRTLTLLTTRVRQVDGMGHYHLPVAPSERTVRLLEPLFDAVIELRHRNGRPEHCWRLVERDVESGWLPL